MTPDEYRQKHKRCRYCNHMKVILAPYGLCEDPLYDCKVKDKLIRFPGLRNFCKCFAAKPYVEQEGV